MSLTISPQFLEGFIPFSVFTQTMDSLDPFAPFGGPLPVLECAKSLDDLDEETDDEDEDEELDEDYEEGDDEDLEDEDLDDDDEDEDEDDDEDEDEEEHDDDAKPLKM